MGWNISPDLTWVDDMKYPTWFSIGRCDDGWFLGTPPPPIQTKDNPEYFGIHTRHQPQDFIVPEKVASDVEFKRSAQGKTTRKSSFLSYAMRGDYTLKPLDYGVHHRGVQLVELVESHCINTWAKIDHTGKVWSTCGRLVADSWWSRGNSNKTAILQGCERRYVELTFLTYVYFTGYVRIMIRVTRSRPE